MMAKPCPAETLRGFDIYREYLNCAAQVALVAALRAVAEKAPFVAPVTPRGKPMSVRMTSAGRFGWVSGPGGYAYADRHPGGGPWPEIPAALLDLWRALAGCQRLPECALVNYYGEGARMGMHQDRDEADFDAPVVSVSLGDDALFRIGNETRGGRTVSTWLRSGDVVVMGGAARLCFHGIDRIAFGTSTLLERGGRLNVTMRVVT